MINSMMKNMQNDNNNYDMSFDLGMEGDDGLDDTMEFGDFGGSGLDLFDRSHSDAQGEESDKGDKTNLPKGSESSTQHAAQTDSTGL
jgi:hypothetical protein